MQESKKTQAALIKLMNGCFSFFFCAYVCLPEVEEMVVEGTLLNNVWMLGLCTHH